MNLTLKMGLSALGIDPTDEIIGAFATYAAALQKWTKVHNLTSVTDEEGIAVKHFLDSVLFTIPLRDGDCEILDVGSGAGFPGIPMKIVRPSLRLTLLEPKGKKAVFLRYIANELNLSKDVIVCEDRLESFRPRGLYDAAVVRALFTADEFVKQVSPLVKPGGLICLGKGRDYKKELTGMSAINVSEFTIPFTDIERVFLTMVKT
ncbi:16S rRNA (guanine(527)-N(7))-methyltransferase RsmG [Candidatus Magnetominusculus dajiuhuensis]|uniref:16S rRNA (guanine(527)-N(7))-methyltransferase RsmG n=1 Tax=Candidatus Magnetominusculus dajiuhuensis TaxID=3137712 RepID=UPI003B42A258